MLKVHESPPSHETDARHRRSRLKQVVCFLRPEKQDAVKEAVRHLNIVGGITITDVRGMGHQKGMLSIHKGATYIRRLLDRVKLELVISENDLAEVTTLIMQLAQTGEVGDGKIFVMDVVSAVRIRTGEKGVDAV